MPKAPPESPRKTSQTGPDTLPTDIPRHQLPTKSSTDKMIKQYRKAASNPKLTSRVQHLRHLLSDIRITLTNRTFLVNIAESFSLFCLTCTSISKPGGCGPTCPLLRPPEKMHSGHDINQAWIRNANTMRKLYQITVQEMNERGNEVYASTVGRWERAVTVLRRDTRTNAERYCDGEWRMVPPIRAHKGFDIDWEFKGNWWEASMVDEDFEPVEASGRRKHRRSEQRVTTR